MPDPSTALSWEDQRRLVEGDLPRERNTDSSVSAQYEDLTPPDQTWDHDGES